MSKSASTGDLNASRIGALAGLCTVLLGALAGAACRAPDPSTAAQAECGMVWMFPGIEGGAWQMRAPIHGMRDAGVELAFSIYDWDRPFQMLTNLIDEPGNRVSAARVADQIAEYRGTHPDAPIHLVGYSGGGGLALMVAEVTPAEIGIENVILVQAAISPKYDLRPALGRVRGRIVNFFCPTDWLTLGMGTSLFGTIDRVNTPSAGLVGFALGNQLEPAQRARIVQTGWTLRQVREGHWGEHMGAFTRRWNALHVAPWLGPPQIQPASLSTSQPFARQDGSDVRDKTAQPGH